MVPIITFIIVLKNNPFLLVFSTFCSTISNGKTKGSSKRNERVICTVSTTQVQSSKSIIPLNIKLPIPKNNEVEIIEVNKNELR